MKLHKGRYIKVNFDEFTDDFYTQVKSFSENLHELRARICYSTSDNHTAPWLDFMLYFHSDTTCEKIRDILEKSLMIPKDEVESLLQNSEIKDTEDEDDTELPYEVRMIRLDVWNLRYFIEKIIDIVPVDCLVDGYLLYFIERL